MTITTSASKIQQIRSGFVQGEITHLTGQEENALMETDVERISNSINTQLIDPVIDFVVASDMVLSETADAAKAAADAAKLLADTADRTAGQAMSKATDALADAKAADTKATTAISRLDSLGSTPNLDDQTWKWMTRLFDTVTIHGSGISLADPTQKPTIHWVPMRQNTETGRYVLQGTVNARIKINLPEWSGGGSTAMDERSIRRWYGWVLASGISNDIMSPVGGSISVTSAGPADTTHASQEHVRHAAINFSRTTSEQIHFSVVANTNDLVPSENPVYATIELKFLRDSGGDFGFGSLYPTLTPSQ